MIIFWFPFACLVCFPPRDTEKTTQTFAKKAKRGVVVLQAPLCQGFLGMGALIFACGIKRAFLERHQEAYSEWCLLLLHCLSSCKKLSGLKWFIVKITQMVSWRVLSSKKFGGMRSYWSSWRNQICVSSHRNSELLEYLRHGGRVV